VQILSVPRHFSKYSLENGQFAEVIRERPAVLVWEVAMTMDPVPGLLSRAQEMLDAEFRALPAFERQIDPRAIAEVLEAAAHRLGDNYPYFHPLYAGQMLKPPHPVARAAYALAMSINPNNHARDGGRASSEMEIEAVQALATMFGWGDAPFLGHLTSSGTLANLEALWVAGQLAPGRRVLASEQAHYTHKRISAVLKIPFADVPADRRGRMNLEALELELRKGDVGTVVVTLGTTAIGAVDPLPEVLQLRERYGFRVHLDGAYGGYFRLIPEALDESARQAYAAMDQADSIVIDPHKHGLQPYGCGCVLFRDPAVGRFYKHDSPYTYFTSKQLHLHPSEQTPLAGGPVHPHPSEPNPLAGGPTHLGEISLECSRAGAAAVALWATQRLLPLTPGGEFARGLGLGRKAALRLDGMLRGDDGFEPLQAGPPELDIVVWKVKADTPGRATQRAKDIFAACATRDLHLALVQLPPSWFQSASIHADEPESEPITCLRSVLMKPEHDAWLDRIWGILAAARAELMGQR
jgi:tyrosine decarboxylase / aspartate 1-decarboxylase